ncbi:type II secretion system F family protein [Candidatus Woesearchaeota archaeon]|nr:type II secretion system F family protein [Candidatus Woesearchaeota archaeon]
MAEAPKSETPKKAFLQRFFGSGGILKGFRKVSRETDFKRLDRREIIRRKQPRRIFLVKYYLERAGFQASARIPVYIFRLAVFLNFIISAYFVYRFSTDLKIGLLYVTVVMAVIWVFVFAAILFLVWLLLYVMLDLRIFKRRVGIEEVLPDFLQLTSANIRAGMTIDKALWYAVRPRFGVLANEIEMVAKETMAGEDLEAALKRFTDKYDSLVLKRAMNLLIESYNAGGEIGDVLNKIADNIKENQIMKKEMSANVTTYAIFIGFATVVASPILFALSGQFLNVIKDIMGRVNFAELQKTPGLGFSFNFSPSSISQTDFTIFAVVSLIITSFFSAAIVATIRKGDVRSGLGYFPVFVGITLSLYFASTFAFNFLFKGLF